MRSIKNYENLSLTGLLSYEARDVLKVMVCALITPSPLITSPANLHIMDAIITSSGPTIVGCDHIIKNTVVEDLHVS